MGTNDKGSSDSDETLVDPAGPGLPNIGSGEFKDSGEFLLSSGRPVTVLPPQVPKAKSSVPYMTIGLAVLAIGVTAIIAVSFRSSDPPRDDPQADEVADSAATAAPEPDAPKQEAATSAEDETKVDAANADDDDAAKPAPLPETKQPLPVTPQAAQSPKAQMQYERGNAYLRKNKVKSAIASYERALEIEPGFTDAAGPLGVAYSRIGYPARAQEAFDEYLRRMPEESRAEEKRQLLEQFPER